MVLDAGGYSVEGKSSVSHGMRDVEIRWGNAGFIAAQSYRFDGVRYRSVGPARKLTPAGGGPIRETRIEVESSRERAAFVRQEFYAQTGLLAGEAVQH
ncbi:hypothetical protein WS88_35975 [Burkholderia cepacia]|nr:hypothetical protein WS88_35975 [Burkholderia cepacia]